MLTMHFEDPARSASSIAGPFFGVRVSDRGIAPDVLPHVFDLFMRADSSSRRADAGVGIGLALVRSLVENHGGSISVASAGLRQGSEFTVRLPMPAR